MNWGEAYYDHFEKFLGKARAGKMWDPDPSLPHNYPIQVLTYEIDKPIRVRAFCTLGLTHYAQELGGLAEIFLSADEGWESIPKILGLVSGVMVEKHIALHHGTCIAGIDMIDAEFVKRYDKNVLCFVFFDDEDSFGVIRGDDGNNGRIHFGVFITQAEYDFLSAQGIEALEDKFEENEIDIRDLD